MDKLTEDKSSVRVTDGISAPAVRPTDVVQEYLLERLPIYRELQDLRKQGWQSEAADTHFLNQRQQADNASAETKVSFYRLMCKIGLELEDITSALTIPVIDGKARNDQAILDLCMAPGGFASAALALNRYARLRGISLPLSQGGHDLLLTDYWSDKNSAAPIFVDFRDITLLADEMGTPVASIPASHPDFASFSSDRPFLGQEFDLVLCDGQVLRTQERSEYRQTGEGTRLLTSQLVLGLQRIRSGGNMIILLHRADAWSSVLLISMFVAFSDHVQLVKPMTAHRTRSSFYLVAKGVRPEHEAAVEAVSKWKAQWKLSTLGLESEQEGVDETELGVLEDGTEERIRAVLREVGPALMRMAEPVFEVQVMALRKAPWMKEAGRL